MGATGTADNVTTLTTMMLATDNKTTFNYILATSASIRGMIFFPFFNGIVTICIQKRRRSNVVEKFREVSDSVWVSFGAVIIEKTLKED
jgi:hypothetical protein